MNRTARGSRWSVTLLGTALLAVTASGCTATGAGPHAGSATSGASGTAASSSSAPTSVSGDQALPSPWNSQAASSVQQAAAAAALAAYRGMWSDLVALSQTPDGYRNPALATHMLYKPLSQWSQTLSDNAKHGEIAIGAPDIDPRVVKVGPGAKPTQVEIGDCYDNTRWTVVDARTRKSTDSKPGGRERTEAMVTLDVDGYWKVTQQVFAQAGTC